MIACTIGAAILFLLSAYYVLPWAVRRALGRRLRSRSNGAGLVALTFDDGPDPECTPAILDALRARGVKATFFALGQAASSQPEIIRSVLAEGHEVGEHGYSHIHPWQPRPAMFIRDLLRGQAALCRARGGSAASLYRPAFGKLNGLSLLYVALRRKKTILWTIDPRDYTATDAQAVATFVLERLHVQGGGIVLLHDGRRSGLNTPARITVEAVDLICSQLPILRLQTCTVTDYMRRLAALTGQST